MERSLLPHPRALRPHLVPHILLPPRMRIMARLDEALNILQGTNRTHTPQSCPTTKDAHKMLLIIVQVVLEDMEVLKTAAVLIRKACGIRQASGSLQRGTSYRRLNRRSGGGSTRNNEVFLLDLQLSICNQGFLRG